MKTIRNTNMSSSNNNRRIVDRIARQVLLAMQGGGLRVNTAFDPQPATPQYPGGPPCGGTQVCRDGVSWQTQQSQNAANRTAIYTAPINGLAAGASVSVTFSATLSPGAIDSLPANGRWRTVAVDDLVSSLASLDSVRITYSVGGASRFSFYGGRFSRSNANDCTTACGFGACAGPQESITITVTNVTASPFGAAETLSLETRVYYQGEKGYVCETDGSCAPSVDTQATDCDCSGGGAEVG